jgi:hypothetical protein
MPKVASRVGLDFDPVDVRDPDARLWQRALIWPEHMTRAENLRRALEIAQETLSPVVGGDALALLPGILNSILVDAIPCVFHTHAVYQFAPEDRHRLYALFVERSALRDVVVRIGMEPSEAGRSVLSIYRHGYAAEQRLADCDYHGAWLAWNADSVRHAWGRSSLGSGRTRDFRRRQDRSPSKVGAEHLAPPVELTFERVSTLEQAPTRHDICLEEPRNADTSQR